MFGTMIGYVYGADGTRVSTGTITTWGSCDPTVNGYQAMKDSILGPSGGQLTETGMDANGAMAWSHTNVSVGGEVIATYDPNGLHFYLNDWQGLLRSGADEIRYDLMAARFRTYELLGSQSPIEITGSHKSGATASSKPIAV